MAKIFRIEGLESGRVDGDEIQFHLKIAGENLALQLATDRSGAEHISSTLAALAQQIPESGARTVPAQPVAKHGVRREAFESHILLQLVTEGGISHMFAVSSAAAADIAARLKTESEKPSNVGRA